MRNEKERKQFINTAENWTAVSEAIPGIRLMELQYKEHSWYRIDIMQKRNDFNYEAHKSVEVVKWRTLGMYKILLDDYCYSEGLSATQIANEIKEIDRGGKK